RACNKNRIQRCLAWRRRYSPGPTGPSVPISLMHCISPVLADFVAEVFCPSECVRLIQDQASMRNVDSRIHSLRFDCCVFLFYSFSAVTFATKSAPNGHVEPSSRCQL